MSDNDPTRCPSKFSDTCCRCIFDVGHEGPHTYGPFVWNGTAK